MTTVLEAWDRLGRGRVALKVPIEPLAGDEAFLDRLQREVMAVAGFAHPNVAAVRAMERDGRAAFVVVELVDGSSLRDMLGERGPLPPAGAAKVAAGTCAAAAAAHAQGIVHGHLTPANVLLAIDGRVKVTDFRLALAAWPTAGIPDPAADLRALGHCLAAMLTGREPADGEPVWLEPALPTELAAIIARAAGDLHGADAYRSAAAMGRDLTRFLATIRPSAVQMVQPRSAPVRAAPPVPAAASSPPADRMPVSVTRSPDRPANAGGAPPRTPRRRLLLLAGLVAAVLAVGVTGAFGLLGREPGRRTSGHGVAPPSSAIPPTTIGQPPTSRGAATSAPSSTEPPTTAPTTRPTTSSGQVTPPGQRIVPNVVGLHRAKAADVLAKAQLGVQIVTVSVRDSGRVQRVISQQPSAGQVVPARSEVTVLVGTKRPTG
jgi:serine/threonine-protein kinase